jgi:4a-hydroxytetrahydrobiopterin dehydratase
MTELAGKTCVPCRGDVPPLKGEELEELSRQVPGWEVVYEHHLRREFRFKNFREALDFVNRVGELAEEQAHHPDMDLGWGRVGVTIFTHKIDGLTESDFILAAKVDRL